MVGYFELLRVVRGFGCYHRSLLRKCNAGGGGGVVLGALPVAQDLFKFGPPGPAGPGWGGKPDQDCSIANINAVLCAGFSKTKVKQVDSRPLTKMGVGPSGFGVLADR